MRDPGDRAHHTPPDPTGPGFPSSTTRKHLSNSHSKLKLDGTREIPSKSINRFINTRWYYRLRQKHLQPCPEAAGSVLPKPTGPRLRTPENFCSRLPEAAPAPNPSASEREGPPNPTFPSPGGREGSEWARGCSKATGQVGARAVCCACPEASSVPSGVKRSG